MPVNSNVDPEPDTVRLKLDCLRMARSLLPRAHRRYTRANGHIRDASTAKVMKLACELYSWISDERPRPRRMQQGMTEERLKVLLKAAEAIVEARGGHGHVEWLELRRRSGMPDPPPKEVSAEVRKRAAAAQKSARRLLTNII